jgi:hypothetical protein
MELIVSSFLLIGLSLFGCLGSVIADRLHPPKRRVWRFAEPLLEPPPRHSRTYSAAAGLQPAAA